MSMLLISCRESSENHENSGIAISFDDHFINEWHALRPLFQKYNAKVTFFVTCGKSLTKDEIHKLKELQNDGHEIGFHGTIHGKSTELIASLGPQKYAETELFPGLKYLSEAGFYPKSYAHPGGNHNDEADSVLFANGFKILRDVAISRRKLYGIPVYTLAPRIMSWIFYPFGHERKVDALLIDTDAELKEEEMNEAIEKAKQTNSALMLFGHEPLHSAPQNGEYGFDVRFLEKILKEAKRQKLRFYTMSQLPDVNKTAF
ncbi:polysaccharide deacetylase family protein [Dyadobacter flavalbus]|uniref:Polysaccharide deacetylase family protein n=2 Tax=Dyadobacter flavalbus TaxID=2579942 RepID=A0A5M8QZY0_9BACT|nr:polysaccharide deacetylase family protein [Dyadobacter flavalbus]